MARLREVSSPRRAVGSIRNGHDMKVICRIGWPYGKVGVLALIDGDLAVRGQHKLADKNRGPIEECQLTIGFGHIAGTGCQDTSSAG